MKSREGVRKKQKALNLTSVIVIRKLLEGVKGELFSFLLLEIVNFKKL
jgi:hypothetical protein